eukprot:CAMPEP_0170565084 /NCGR_PEP_ID=MMETSP0211-20121228/76618_1 /TAXON_ID=311385 /ORGANISM="Pseudokeronopsis sp., Strain OXSARD2" /LENGTH=58 /DNA_ID=CAMNT_0010885393 /DNA_START=165 /DNA_END=341 /DNA_ORIENTATION=+
MDEESMINKIITNKEKEISDTQKWVKKWQESQDQNEEDIKEIKVKVDQRKKEFKEQLA